jgi:serine/threonine protein kinase
LEVALSDENSLRGTTLAGRFRIDRLIGTGGMAAVYEATDLELGRAVAVKLFRVDPVDDPGGRHSAERQSVERQSVERQSAEMTLLAGLNHFALVTLFDAGSTQIDEISRAFLVMEFIDGRDLRSRIGEGIMSRTEVATMGADLTEALHYVHSRGIIHRDIKPANILLSNSNFPGRAAQAKLADFGIARLFDSTHLTMTGATLGTAGYLSPEQALGKQVGPASDVYSLGLVLLECLTGERAFPGTAVESAMARLQRQPEIAAALGAAWVSLLTGMVARDPLERPSAETASRQLRSLVGSEESETPTLADTPTLAHTPTLPLSADSADLDTVAMTAADIPTLVLSAADAPTEPRTPTITLAPSLGSTVSPSLRTRLHAPRRWIIGLVIAGVLMTAVFLAVFPGRGTATPSAPDTPAPSYPAVDGPLGTHLQQLQESLTP